MRKSKILVGMVGGETVDQRERVEVDLVLPAAIDGPHHAVPGAVAAQVEAIVIVQFFRPVDADADEELVLMQKPAPVSIVQEQRVGLERVAHLLAVMPYFLWRSTALL